MGVSGGARVGGVSSTVVNVLTNDDPNGALGEYASQLASRLGEIVFLEAGITDLSKLLVSDTLNDTHKEIISPLYTLQSLLLTVAQGR